MPSAWGIQPMLASLAIRWLIGYLLDLQDFLLQQFLH